MADEQIVTNIVATSDFSNLITDLNKVSSALTKLQDKLQATNKTLAAQVAVMNRSFADTIRSTGQFSTHFVSLTSDVDKFGQQLDRGQMKLGQFFRVYAQHAKSNGGLIRDLAKQQVQLQNSVLQPLGKNAEGLMQYNVHIPRGIDVIKNKTAIARQELQIMNKVVQEGAGQLINWGKNTQWAGRQLTVGLTVPMAAFGKASADAFRTADEQLVRLTKVYGGISQTSSSELLKVRKDVIETARQISKSMGASFNETIGLAADIAATGKTGNELLKSVQETTRLAVLGEVDRQEAMKATLAIQTAFKSNTEELTESINFLNAVENQTSTTLNDLVEAIPKAGPIVKGLGGDVKDLALYLTAMREGGINASEGANALKSALASIINPTKVAKEQFMGFGIDLSGIVNKNAGDLTGTILSIQAALETLDPLKKSQAIEQLFGKFQFARMNALFENLGKQGSQTLQVLDLMKSSSQDLAGIAGRELSQITESASGQYRRAIESLKADLAGLGEQFLKISTFFIKTVDGLVKFINNLPGPLKTVITLLTGFTALAGPLIMLTGVFANFIGYVIKGIGHIRALGRGGEGFKLLTPEILAAEQAGSLIEKTFYSDAQAAAVLKTALSNLTNELTILQQKAASGSISVQPTLSTIQGGIIAEGAQRVADPNNPLIGKPYSRQMSHLNPVAGMTNAERAAQTIFGVVPGPGPVNQRIGKNPQVYAEGDLPKVEGLTSIKGVSTGIVAQEAAKWHSMTAALAMQSKEEIALLKREVASTGAVTTELSTSYQALLPQMTNITTMAAQEAKLIVAQLQAGKVTVDQARAKIIALNAQVEAMMAETAAAVAATQGRVLNVSAVPLTGQPVVDPTTGKTNMKEMFHKSKTSALVDKIARSLGVRTSGGGYSTHTTIPKRFNAGNIVPGTGNMDTVPAILTPGEFVVNKEATAQNLPLLQAINGGGGSNGPGYNDGTYRTISSTMQGITPEEISTLVGDRFNPRPNAKIPSYRVRGTAGVYLGAVTDPALVKKYPHLSKDGKTISRSQLNKSLEVGGLPPEVYRAAMKASPVMHTGSSDQLLHALQRSGVITGDEYQAAKQRIDIEYDKYLRNPKLRYGITDDRNRYWEISDKIIKESLEDNRKAIGFWNKYSSEIAYLSSDTRRSPSMKLKSIEFEGQKVDVDPLKGTRGKSFFAHTRTPTPLLRRMADLGIGQVGKLFTSPTLARGRYVPRAFGAAAGIGLGATALSSIFGSNQKPTGYNQGGMVGGMPARRYKAGGQVASMALGMGGSMIGQQAGQSVAGDMGGMAGGMLGFMLPGMLMSRGGGGGAASIKAAIMGISRMNLAIGATVTVLGAAYSIYKKHNEQVRLSALGYNLSEEAASKAGIKYTSLSDSLKNAIQNAKDLAEKNKLAYESLASSGTPLNMTIEQYKKLKEEVKTTMPELIKLIDITKTKDVGDLAVRLKTQFIAMGMSAQEATNKIYALISASEKSGLASGSISSNEFRAVTDKSGAAVSSMKSLNKAIERKGPDVQAQQLQSTILAINAGIDEAVKKGTDYNTAVNNQFNAINAQVKTQGTLTLETITHIEKMVPELNDVLNTTDNGTSAWAKYQLMVNGVTEGLYELSGEAAIALEKANRAIRESVRASATGEGGSLSVQSKQLTAYNKQIAKLEDQSKGQSVQSQINNKEEIKTINKKIDAINKEYDARKKALSLQQQTEDANIAIQKAQLEYQNALASGDMASAAQAQLNIRGIVGQRQNQLAQDALETSRQAKIQPLEDRKNALSEAEEKMANSAALAGEKLESLKKSAQGLKEYIDSMIGSQSKIKTELIKNPDYLKTEEGKNAAASLYKDIATNDPNNPDIKKLKQKYASYTPGSTGDLRTKYNSNMGIDLYNTLQGNVTYSSAAKEAITAFTTAEKVQPPIDALYPGTSRRNYEDDPYAQGWGSPTALNPGNPSYKPNNIKKPGPTLLNPPRSYSERAALDPYAQGWGSPNFGKLSSPSYAIPKNNVSYTPGSTSTTNKSEGNTYSATVILNGSNMNPQQTAEAVLKEFQKLNAKAGRDRGR